MNGIVFAGCSFTWGQGLYYYSNMKNVINQGDQFTPGLVTDAHVRYKDTLRFARLVANHFNGFEVVRGPNGGSDMTSMNFVNNLFNPKEFNDGGKYDYSEIDYIILQTSQIVRNHFDVEIDGKIETLSCYQHDPKLIKWLVINNLTFNEWFNMFTEQVFQKIKDFVIFYESKGIKTKVWCWQDDLIKYLKTDSYFSDKFIKFEYEGEKYDCLDYMINLNENLLISNDKINFTELISDHHPSKLCHEIIAKSIIKNIEKDLI